MVLSGFPAILDNVLGGCPCVDEYLDALTEVCRFLQSQASVGIRNVYALARTTYGFVRSRTCTAAGPGTGDLVQWTPKILPTQA